MSNRVFVFALIILTVVLIACQTQQQVVSNQTAGNTAVGIVKIEIQAPPNNTPQQQIQTQPTTQVQETPTAAIPELEITSPAEGQELTGGKVTIKVNVKNFNLVDYSTHRTPKDGEGHLHFFIDQGRYQFTYFPSYTYTDVPAGEHEAEVFIVYSDHTNYNPVIVKKVKFVMK